MSIESEQKPVPPMSIIDEPPPVLGTWPRVYAIVLAYLVVVIVAFYCSTRSTSAA